MADAVAATKTKVNRALVRASVHPVAYAISRVLGERGTASGKEIAAALSKPRSTIGDQLRRLELDGLIECVAEERKRGTVERFYRATPAALWLEDEEMSGIGADEKKRMGLRVVQSTVADSATALSANTLDRRDNWCLSSARLIVDECGWQELAEIHRRALEEVERVRTESAARLAAEEGGESVRALSSLMLLELPGAENSLKEL